MIKLKVSIVNILFSSLFFTVFFPFRFKKGEMHYYLLSDMATSFIIYFSICTVLITVLFLISFILGRIIPKNLREKRVKISFVLLIMYSIILLPPILYFANEPNAIIMIACVAIIFNVLLEMLSQMHFRSYTGKEILHTLFKYTLISLIPLFALTTIMVGIFT